MGRFGGSAFLAATASGCVSPAAIVATTRRSSAESSITSQLRPDARSCRRLVSMKRWSCCARGNPSLSAECDTRLTGCHQVAAARSPPHASHACCLLAAHLGVQQAADRCPDERRLPGYDDVAACRSEPVRHELVDRLGKPGRRGATRGELSRRRGVEEAWRKARGSR